MKPSDAIFSSASTQKIPNKYISALSYNISRKVTLEKLAITVEKYPFSV